MAQLGHPYSSQVKASQKRRLRELGAKAGKSFGSSASQFTKKYPKKGAGTQREFTIPGKSARPRADRYANGGAVSKRRHVPHQTNIIISHAGGRGGIGGGGGGGRPIPVPVPRPPTRTFRFSLK